MATEWSFDDGAIYDEDGNEVAVRPEYIDDDIWERNAERICDAMNAAAKEPR